MKRVIPFGDRIIVRRRRVGTIEKAGLIELPDSVKDRPTDVADVVYVPDHTFADIELIKNAQVIIQKISLKMQEGDIEALKSMITFNAYLRLKMLRPGMTVFINKYTGVDFHDNEGSGMMCLINAEDILGRVENDTQSKS